MATPLEALENRKKLLASNLGSSPTAFAPSAKPAFGDVSIDKQLASVNKQIDDLRSTQIRNQWYGPSTDDTAEDSGGDDGLIMSGLKALQRPLNAIAGTAQYALGKGTKSGLASNVNEAMKTGVTFGNVLQQEGAPRAVQVPLGFALDVMLDPVNWLTAGTAALIPRAGVGLIKGGYRAGATGALEGLATGVTSNLAKKGATAMNLVPFVKRMSQVAPVLEEGGIKASGLSNLISKGATKYSDLADKLGQKAIAGGEKFDTLMGTDVYSKLNRTPIGLQGGTIGNTVEELIKKVPSTTILGKATPSGEQIVDFFKYSPKKAADIADLKDKVINLARSKGVILIRSQSGSTFESIDDFLKPGATMSLPDKLGETMEVVLRDADGIVKPEFAGKVKVYDSIENAEILLGSAADDINTRRLLEAAYKQTPMGKTGVQWYDNVIDRLKSTTVDDVLHARLGTGNIVEGVQAEADDLVKAWNSYDGIKDLKPLEKLLTAQQSFISLFKSAKVPMNVASHVVSNIGNFFMGTMMGLPMWKSQYLKSMAEANLFVKGRLGANGFKDMFFSDVNSLIDMAEQNPTRFKQMTGMDPMEIASKLSAEEKLVKVIRPNTSREEMLKVLKESIDNIESGLVQGDNLSSFEDVSTEAAKLESASKINKSLIKEKLGSYPTPSQQLERMLKESGSISRADEFGTFTTSEISHNARFEKVKEFLAKEAAKQPYNPAYRLANTLVNSMPKWYEHIDQSFKIGTSNYLTKVGLTEEELLTISRTVSMTKDDLLDPVYKGGEKLYRLTQLKASEVATEAFMNYSAMPDFVRVMRALPVAGSPFLSFPYAMAIKTGKTAINNPAIFNKVGFMINEMNASRTPQEKEALESKYNEYMKSPTVVKMFGMWNTNVKNLIPYYQMNMFNPSQRDYADSPQGDVMKVMDKFPVMQDPVGSVIKDYFIQPWVLSGSGQAPQGMFGEPLYPSFDEDGKKIDSSLTTKALYGGRAIAESMVPGALSFAGLLNAPDILSPGAINAVPSYGFRNLANATQGRSSIGATTKEDAIRKTLRSLLGRSGLPAYTLDPTKTSSK